METRIKVLVADDNADMHQSLNLMLAAAKNIEICGYAANGAELLELMGIHMPDMAIVDIKMPVMDGIEATELAGELYPGTKILALTLYGHEDYIVRMLKAGAKGYVMKNADAATLLNAIYSIMQGDTFFCTSTNNKITDIITGRKSHKIVPPLPENFFKPNEAEILQLICKEYTTRQISSELGLTEKTVETYRKRLLRKTNKLNTAGLAVFAIQHGIY